MKWKWLFLLGLTLACDDFNDCEISNYSDQLYVQFKNYSTGGNRTVKFNAMNVTFSDNQTISYVDEDGGNSYAFPVDVTDTVTYFQFTTDSINYDFELRYNLEAILENPDCGLVFRAKGLRYNELTNFDSVAFKVTELTKLAAPHVEIYF